MQGIRRTRSSPPFAAIVAGALLAAAPARGSVVRVLSLEELVARSAAIAVVTVESTRASWVDGRIVTDATLVVEDGLWGAESGDRLAVRTLGGEVDELGQRVFGEPRFLPGERYLVFLEPAAAEDRLDLLRPIGMSQGALPVREGADGAQLEPNAELPLLVEPGVAASVAPWLAASRPLGEVLAEVRAAVRARQSR